VLVREDFSRMAACFTYEACSGNGNSPMLTSLCEKSASTAPSKIGGNALISRWTSRIPVQSEKNVDTTVDAARLEARATKREVGTRIFMAPAWAIGPWNTPCSRGSIPGPWDSSR
jgi:hypothetical protein